MPDLREFARTALAEVTAPSSIGDFVGEEAAGDGVTTFRFATTLVGYPGWNWTITVAQIDDAEPTVVESELLPADGALLAPDWVPWSERMEDYRAAQAAAAAAGEAVDVDGDDADDDDADDADDDDDDDDVFGSDVLHGGDLDGVDIDEIDDTSGEDDPDDDVSDEDLDADADADADGVEGSELFPAEVGESQAAEQQADGGSEKPPRAPRRRKSAREKDQKDDAGN